MKHCFGYVRVSSHKQGEGVSLDAQKDAILRFAGANGITIIRWFEEQQTAAKSGRPVFDTMLKALGAGHAQGVVMHKIDRLARNYSDWAKIGELVDSGIDLHFAAESLDFRTRGGRLSANIQMAVAEDYVRNLCMEIYKGQRGQLERGLYPFAAPIGYQNNGKNALKTIDPIKGPLIQQAFELYASGQYSLHSLRRELAKRGLAKPSGQPLSKGCLEKFLANPFYTGVIKIRRTGEVFEGGHEPLISSDLFQRVADVRAGKAGKKVTRHNHLFRGLFKCGHCQRSMIPEKQKGHVYYRCQHTNCPTNCIREERLAEAIESVLTATELSEQCLAEIDKRVAHWSREQAKSASDRTMKMQLAKLDERLERLEDAAIDQIIDAESFAKRKQKLLAEKGTIKDAMRETARVHQNPVILRRFLERLKNLAEHYHFADPPEKREIVEIAVSNRTVQDKSVFVEPSNWLRATGQAVAVLSCADDRTTSRTETVGSHGEVGGADKSSADEQHLRKLVEIARSAETERLLALANEDDQRAHGEADGYSAEHNCL